ncbi:MAG: hypothetical protein A2077_05885 [Nitrospirae bacterium GWC2_46_6]|nr:MAG: hypothetical protein A2Z82_03910 [Nitrospirae bacterium GWA2_46_11]OGW21283.1 MAG: hypothetical protein A2077_05885 [Nitrospirae bacterium GWC2_46_6]OGW23424.1 MAG: hypothetical protein A2X55_01195 [Nitrospirae bacterium GWB2_47_37]HAK88993.1 magnesium transporter CorA [Nitrospiraceae bacterium]HCZ12276.1 magnesium transporter CorA [Nitrospiraceae bacterium]
MIETFAENKELNFKWIDVVNPSSDELFQVAEEYGLHNTSIQDCLDPDHLPKYEEFDNVTFFMFRIYDKDASEDADTVWSLTRKVAVFCSSNFIITVHRSEVDFITAMRSKWQAACCDKNINFFLLLDIVRMSIHTYEKPLNDLNLKIDEYEEKLFTTRKDRANVLLIQDLYALKRKASVFHKMLDLTVDTVAQLKTDNNKNRPLIQDIRESANRFFFRANNIVENANNLIGLNLSLSTYRTNEVMRILTIFSVFFMPLTFLVGVYGMNFKHMPELDTAWGYPFAWGLMIVITYSIYRWFRKRGWL